jgi:hypothetical protein
MLIEVDLPKVNQQELSALLAGLDELPGKIGRALHHKISAHVEQRLKEDEEARNAPGV